MKNSIFIFAAATSLICGYSSVFSQTQWQIQKDFDHLDLLSVSTAGRDVAWIAGGGQDNIYRTVNGGQTWIKTSGLPSSDGAVTCLAIDSLTAFVGGVNETERAGLYRTIDGGQSWNIVYTPPLISDWWWCWIYFFNTEKGIACCEDKSGDKHILIVKTDDGGENWTPIGNQPASNSNEYPVQNIVHFYDSLNGWFGTGFDGRVFRTINGGETWEGFESCTNGIMVGVRFISPLIGIRTSTDPSRLARSTDGGQTWTEVTDLPVLNIHNIWTAASVSTPVKSQLWVSGVAGAPSKPFILTSTDGGVTWEQQSLPELVKNDIYHISAVTFGASNDSVQAFGITMDFDGPVGSEGQILNYRQPIGLGGIPSRIRPDYTAENILLENYPNPFNSQTTIEFVLPAQGKVTLIIYNALGQEVEKLVDAEMSQGSHQVAWNAKNYNSGVYFCNLTTNNFSQIRRMVLLRQ
jgi:photosystem II stability/assembly factor-like uncharacterized protein